MTTRSFSTAARDHLLAFADDEHMIGARHTNWIGLGPFLEEDLAFCSIAQDELGHAIGLYELLLDDAGRDRAELDAFAMLRPAAEYRSCWLAEIECSEWNDSLVRHWLYDRAEDLRWRALVGSSDERVAALAARALREESFHLAHAEQFMSRIAGADQTGRIAASIERLVPIARGVWTAAAHEADAVAEGVVSSSSSVLAAQWEELIRSDLATWGLAVELPTGWVGDVQRERTVRSDGFDTFHADLRRVIELDLAAVW